MLPRFALPWTEAETPSRNRYSAIRPRLQKFRALHQGFFRMPACFLLGLHHEGAAHLMFGTSMGICEPPYLCRCLEWSSSSAHTSKKLQTGPWTDTTCNCYQLRGRLPTSREQDLRQKEVRRSCCRCEAEGPERHSQAMQ